jgi:Ca2+-binding RTX toxin-like protein
MVFSILYQIIIVLSILSIFTLSLVNVFATETNPINATNDFSIDLKSKINNLMSKALNDTGSVLNSSVLSNETNLTSSQVVISENKVVSSVSSSGSDSDNSIIKNEVRTINGECSSIKVGGNGNDTLASSGNCNDELTGGPGSDKFTCGEGDDTIRDYNSEEDDIILDRQNCEKIL